MEPLRLSLDLDGLQRIRADQTEALYQGGRIGLIASLAAAWLLYGFLVYHGHVSFPIMTVWVAVMMAQTIVRIVMIQAYKRIAPPPRARAPWATAFTLGALTGGMCWGVGSLLMVTPGEFDIQLLVVVVISALVYASLSGFGSYQPFYALLIPALSPLVIWSAFQGDIKHLLFAVLGFIWLPVTAWLGYRHDDNVIASYRLRYENIDLMEDLRIQKERAEQANIAKSRFLASASHDLRQPVHALGMFVGALKSHDMTPPARRLLGHVENSVAALDSLFTSLLDISRLDAGVISADITCFPIQPLLERICGDLEGQARAKGLRLSLMPCSALVESDPVLLERILRNLIHNAVRYTTHGRVLVGCRRGAVLRIQVLDTGAGIAADQHERVFEEFFQVGNAGRDRAQGLGLGLAIVRRLTRLLDHSLSLKSHESKGSLFEVSVPMGLAQNIDPPAVWPVPGPGQGLLLVIDDELAIREAMRSLLESWGYGVLTAASQDEMLSHMVDISNPPNLIISDYRLGDGENGISVIRRLQSEFNDDIPAILVTGDTAPDRLNEARDSGFLLLHKPLSAERLRAAIHPFV